MLAWCNLLLLVLVLLPMQQHNHQQQQREQHGKVTACQLLYPVARCATLCGMHSQTPPAHKRALLLLLLLVVVVMVLLSTVGTVSPKELCWVWLLLTLGW